MDVCPVPGNQLSRVFWRGLSFSALCFNEQISFSTDIRASGCHLQVDLRIHHPAQPVIPLQFSSIKFRVNASPWGTFRWPHLDFVSIKIYTLFRGWKGVPLSGDSGKQDLQSLLGQLKSQEMASGVDLVCSPCCVHLVECAPRVRTIVSWVFSALALINPCF